MTGIVKNVKTGETSIIEIGPAVDPGAAEREAAKLKQENALIKLKSRGAGVVTREEFNDLLDVLGI